MRPPRWSVLAIALALLPFAPSLRAGTPPGPIALVVLPPGEGDTVTMQEFLQNQSSGKCADLGPNWCDQRLMYRDWKFRDGSLSPDASHVAGAVSTEHPAAGVTIVRDRFGVPHIFAAGPDEATIERRLAYGIGVAQAEERLFQMEILRRAAEGRLSDLLGPPYIPMDVQTRRETETPAERHAQVQSLLTPNQRRALHRYADGVNAVIQRDSQDPSSMPAGFQLLQDLPIRTWTVSDTVAILILETKSVAESAGNEVGYAALAKRLAARYGVRRAVSILDDLQLTGDPLSPTSVPHDQPARRTTDGIRYHFIEYTRADTARRIVALDGPSVQKAREDLHASLLAVAMANRSLGLPVFGSNAWAVAPSRSKTGGALLWGGPQVSYYAPAVLDEMEIDGGKAHVRGVGVPGGGPALAIGYSNYLAWSLTSAQDDQTDTYVDRIRRAPNGKGLQYFWRGAWRPVRQRTVTIRYRTQTPPIPLQGPVAPPVYRNRTVTLYRTMHGPRGAPLPCVVFSLDIRAGVAYCRVRAFWNVELREGTALVGVSQARSLGQFQDAIRHAVAGFNFVYADARGNIGYWHTGRVPIRAPGVDPRLPSPGGGRFDWRGFLPPKLWPSVIDPAQGFVASWNNKPQRSWPDSGDGSLWGAYQRVRQPMRLLESRRRFDQTSLWGVARRTGEVDLRATLGFKRFIAGLPSHLHLTPIERKAVAQVARWDGTAFYPGGTERRGNGKPTGLVAGAGFPILSRWFHALERVVASRVFGPVVPGPDHAAGVRSFTQTPATTSPEFEFFDDYDAFVYNVMAGRTKTDFLGRRSVWQASLAALDQAIAVLRKHQGPDPAKWRAPMPRIDFFALDVSGVPSLPWENRGTWGQAVSFPR